MSVDEARALLFGAGRRDFTDEGFREALDKVDQGSPTLAKQITRALEPVRRQYLPRRQVAWQDTSHGLRARLRLLPDNPHVDRDAQLVGEAFGIPAAMLRGNEPASVPIAESIPMHFTVEQVRQQRAVVWLSVHRHCAMRRENTNTPDVSEFLDGDPLSMSVQALDIARAVAKLDLSRLAAPDWLRLGDETGAPFDVAVTRLCRRHHLPDQQNAPVAGQLRLRILTGDPSCLRSDINFAQVLLQMTASGAAPAFPDAFGVELGGIDEYFTFDDWKDIWQSAVQLRQQWLLRARGAARKGGLGPKLDDMVAVMPVYRRMVLDGCGFTSAHRQEQLANGPAADLDDSTVRDHIKEIERLLAPTASE